MNHGFPLPNDLNDVLAQKVLFSSKADLGTLIKEFFAFYGRIYELPTHLISLNIGRWQEKRLQKTQKNLSPAQKW